MEEYLRNSKPVGRPKGSKNATFLYFTDYYTEKIDNELKREQKNTETDDDWSSDSESGEFYHRVQPVFKYSSRKSLATR